MITNALGFTPVRADANRYAGSTTSRVLSTAYQDLLTITLPINGTYLVLAQLMYHGTTQINKDIYMRIYNGTKKVEWGYKKMYAGKENDTMGAGEMMLFCYATDGIKNNNISLQAMVSALGVTVDDCRILAIRL